jgi:hypothetical protein
MQSDVQTDQPCCKATVRNLAHAIRTKDNFWYGCALHQVGDYRNLLRFEDSYLVESFDSLG